jgi:hydroxypyruvate isomerase
VPLSRRSFLVATALAATTSKLAKADSSFPVQYAANIEMWWRKLPFVDRIHAAADAGFDAIEFWPWRGKDIDAVAKVCKERGVEVAQFTAWGFTPGMNNPKNHAAFVKEIEASCKVAHTLGCQRMTVVCGNDQKGMTQKEMHEHIITGLKLASSIAEREQIMLIIEPMNIRVDHPGHCLYGSEDAVRICREVGSPMVKINWDLYHMQISEGDLCGHLREGIDQLGYVQVADHPGRHEPTTGEIQYKRVFQELEKLGYEGPIGVECSPAIHEATAIERLKTLT